jgi:hypothetical protein
MGKTADLAQSREQFNQQAQQAEDASNKQTAMSAVSAAVMVVAMCYSDERLKTVLGYNTRGLDDIMQLFSVDYQYTEESGLNRDIHTGYVAQDVQDIIPEAVVCQDNGYLAVDPMPILAAAVNAIKELKTEIEALKEIIRQGA